MSADERRLSVLHAARIEFGSAGYSSATTDAIARRVGVSQPYLFRLFPTKKAIFLATVEDCFDQLERLFAAAAEGLTGEEALFAMGRAYSDLVEDKAILQMQLQMWATACQDDEVRALARRRLRTAVGAGRPALRRRRGTDHPSSWPAACWSTSSRRWTSRASRACSSGRNDLFCARKLVTDH